MTDQSSDLVQGTLDMLILKTLARGTDARLRVSVRIEQMSGGIFRRLTRVPCLLRSSGYAALERSRRMEDNENSRRAKYYSLTDGAARGSSPKLEMDQASGGDCQNFGGVVRGGHVCASNIADGMRALFRKERLARAG